MGGGTYSVMNSLSREAGYATMDTAEIFTRKSINNLMDPKNTIRECCDSEEHPNTIPIIIALDVTGSMGYVPDKFVREEMSKMLGSLYNSGLTESQILFLGIGDHECDRAPLQVGQFEADDQLMDKWLKDIYLEGGGGGNAGESYLLAWYYAARNTKIDSFDKRGKKGFLFTIGDEPNLTNIPERSQRNIFGENGVYEDITSNDILKEASEKYNVYHFNIGETRSGGSSRVQDSWKQNLQDNAIMLDSYKDVGNKIVEIIKASNVNATVGSVTTPYVTEDKEEEIL